MFEDADGRARQTGAQHQGRVIQLVTQNETTLQTPERIFILSLDWFLTTHVKRSSLRLQFTIHGYLYGKGGLSPLSDKTGNTADCAPIDVMPKSSYINLRRRRFVPLVWATLAGGESADSDRMNPDPKPVFRNTPNSHIQGFKQEMFFPQQNRSNHRQHKSREHKNTDKKNDLRDSGSAKTMDVQKLIPSRWGLECSWNWLQNPSQTPWMTQHPRICRPTAPVLHGCRGSLQTHTPRFTTTPK